MPHLPNEAYDLEALQQKNVPKKVRKFPISTFTGRNHLARHPSTMTCLNCLMPIKRTVKEGFINKQTHVVAALMTPILLTWAPYAFRFAKDVIHRCPFCRVQLGVTEFRIFGKRKYPKEKHITYAVTPKELSQTEITKKKNVQKKIVIQDPLENDASSEDRKPVRHRGAGQDKTTEDSEKDIMQSLSIDTSLLDDKETMSTEGLKIIHESSNMMTSSVESSVDSVHMKPATSMETNLEQILEEIPVGIKCPEPMAGFQEAKVEEITDQLPMEDIKVEEDNIEAKRQLQETESILTKTPILGIAPMGHKVTQPGRMESKSADTPLVQEVTRDKIQKTLQSHSHPTTNSVANKDAKPRSYSPDARQKQAFKNKPDERKPTPHEHRHKKSPQDHKRSRPGEVDVEVGGPSEKIRNHKRKHAGKSFRAEGDDTQTRKPKIEKSKQSDKKDEPKQDKDMIIAYSTGASMNFIVPGSLVTHTPKDDINTEDISEKRKMNQTGLGKLHQKTNENSIVPWEASRSKPDNYPGLLKRARRLDSNIAQSIGGPSLKSLSDSPLSAEVDQQQQQDHQAQLVRAIAPIVGLNSTDASTEEEVTTHRFSPQTENAGNSTKPNSVEENLEPDVPQLRNRKLQRGIKRLTGHESPPDSSTDDSQNDVKDVQPLDPLGPVKKVYPKCGKCNRPKRSKNKDETPAKNTNS